MTGFTHDHILEVLARDDVLFARDLAAHGMGLDEIVRSSRFLVIGGAGAIGRAVVKALFARAPRALHVVDLSENSLVELVRDIRSSLGYIEGEFRTYCLDYLERSFDAFVAARAEEGDGYEYVLDFAALKHVRSEEDPFTLMRMVHVNALGVAPLEAIARRLGARRLFCVSSDKAVNPVSLMGASKHIMELGLLGLPPGLEATTARFANVAFSDGSLPDGWRRRLDKRQPLSAPQDVLRYFLTHEEAAVLCLLAALVAEDREILVPRHLERLALTRFSDMAERFLHTQGLTAERCASEDEARARVEELAAHRKWPVYFFESDTTGEKPFEEFVGAGEHVEWDRFEDLGVVHPEHGTAGARFARFVEMVGELRDAGAWTKQDLVSAFLTVVPNLMHEERDKYLDARM